MDVNVKRMILTQINNADNNAIPLTVSKLNG